MVQSRKLGFLILLLRVLSADNACHPGIWWYANSFQSLVTKPVFECRDLAVGGKCPTHLASRLVPVKCDDCSTNTADSRGVDAYLTQCSTNTTYNRAVDTKLTQCSTNTTDSRGVDAYLTQCLTNTTYNRVVDTKLTQCLTNTTYNRGVDA